MKRNNTIYVMTIIALEIAIMAIMGFTPVGTINVGYITITLIGIPVAIIACLFGPWMGALAGLTWGVISLIQGVTGIDPTGPIFLAINPFGFVFTVFVPRILAGLLGGLIYRLNTKWDKKGYVNAIISSASVSLLNTILFMTSLCLFFFATPEVQAYAQALSDKYGVNAFNPLLFIIFFVGFNALVELAVNGIVGSACVYGINKAAKAMGVSSVFASKSKTDTPNTQNLSATANNEVKLNNDDLFADKTNKSKNKESK